MFPKSRRFQDTVNCAPAVGSYNIENSNKKAKTALFPKSKRFGESKENLPGPCDTASLLDISSCSVSSKTSNTLNYMSTPKPKVQARLQALERTIESLKQELCLLREQNQALRDKASIEKTIIVLKEDKSTATEDDLPFSENIQKSNWTSVEGMDVDMTVLLANKEKELANLQMMLKCEQENCKADIDLEKTRNMALKTRIAALEQTNQETSSDRDQVEEENKKLQGLTDELRKDNLEIMKKLDILEHDLEVTCEKLVKIEAEGEEKIQNLKSVNKEEVVKTKIMEQKYAERLKSCEEKLSASTRSAEELYAKNVCYENKIEGLEQRLVQVTEQEQRANEDLGCLKAEKLSLESQLEQCHHDYDQRLQLAACKTEKLQEEIKSNQELMTENFKALTAKYTALEESYDIEKSNGQKEIQKLQATLEATKTSLSSSNKEHEDFISTFNKLKDKLVEEQNKNEYLQDVNQDLVEKLFSSQSRTSVLEKELGELNNVAQETKKDLEDILKKKQENIDSLELELKMQLQNFDNLKRIEKSQNEKLSNIQTENESLKNENQKAIAELEHENERYQHKNECLKKDMKEMTVDLEQKVKEAEEKAVKIKEEFGRRLVETQKKLSQNEINNTRINKENNESLQKLEDQILRLKQEHEKEKESLETVHERTLQSCQDEIKNLKEKLSRHNSDSQIAHLKQQIEIWQNKFEELEEKIEPFKEQLDAFEAEKKALLSQNCEAQNEVSKLGAQYAKLLGHQNQKQKIHHVLKLKNENIELKCENSKLREQCEKQKRSLKKMEEKLDSSLGKKRFDPSEAFSHAKKENRVLTIISHGNTSQHK